MPLKSLAPSPLYRLLLETPVGRAVQRLHSVALEPGSLEWLLAEHRALWCPAWLMLGWRGHKAKGAGAWPAVVLLVLCLLRWSEAGMSRRAACRRAEDDRRWRAALGIPADQGVPSERTLRDFEKYLRERAPGPGVPRYLLLFEHIVRACRAQGVGTEATAVAMDSTPLWCYGAVKDTVRLLGEGVLGLARRFAQGTQQSLAEVAQQWAVPWVLGKSIKGALGIDWRDEQARQQALSEMAQQVLGAVSRMRRDIDKVRPGHRKALLRRAGHLMRILADDLEADESGRLVIARRVARDRMISLTDPQARHGHKSRKQTFEGFKTHVVGDVVSGLLLALCVTPGNEHDSRPAHRLIGRARSLMAELREVLGDTAYGGARLRHLVRGTLAVSLISPPPPVTSAKDRLGRAHFQLDPQAGRATCPAGVGSQRMSWSWNSEAGVHVPRFSWPKKTCDACSLSSACRGKRSDGQIVLGHPYEDELRRARADFARPEVRAHYRDRSQVERMMNLIVAHGGRTARAFGLGAAQLQVHCIAMASNLKLLAAALCRPRRLPVL